MEQLTQDRSLDSQGRLAGKTYIVTGGAGLFGLSLAQAIRDEGANVVISCFTETDQPSFTEARCAGSRAGALIWASGDTRDPQYCLALVRYACRTFGRVDGVINNADYEFQPVWPPIDGRAKPLKRGARTMSPFDSIECSTNVIENLHQAALEGVVPGGIVIHTFGPHKPAPVVEHPIIPVTGRYRETTSSEQQLSELGIRVVTIHPGPAWSAGLVEKYPLRLTRERIRALRQQNQAYIQMLL